ncbi:heat-shock protein [Flavobacterium psychrophilum]|uniref:Tetracyclin repressor-like C-terminal domain-containing protein n=5 Tax=Flavobacterium psychrophilum TaxID=96345 RepID=A6GZQ6_FLAPJ|nr:TetR family transcriptional regulator C-terminal domain-containing protein [Flavobacterium psychrophilum]AIG30279.1 heat-shock protein [Flavobacterium psychrophilum]AIG32555.1 heat-shock protein [Flavobacterium psychrophilum]AIG34710.1 heat-shock protein [Flavobacterium psychrophilum]AIG37075.1 heat-shock protein [Flavobacterium psychrophilum]AIG39339.1 heat-shock protein [Flavobacterium psychrophilum]
MATAKKKESKKDMIDDNKIISLYMNDVLENNHNTKNVYVFCKNNAIEESDFYSFFGSLEAVKQSIWNKFFENTISTLEKDENYANYPDKNKLLSLYFTLFEILTLNRSYVVFSLLENKEGIRNLKDFKEFRNHFKHFINNMIENNNSIVNDKIAKITKPVFSEGAWIQFLFILKFWLDDTSKSFEKTDIIIEKSVNTVVDLLDTKPLESLFDLGKFLWKEKMI